MRGGFGVGRKAALAGLAALVLAAALAAPAQGVTYIANMEMPEGQMDFGSVSGFGKEVQITAATNRGYSLFANYSGPGRTTRRGVFGKLGRFGSVALRFEPEGKPIRRSRPKACTGGPRVWVTWKGTFSGRVRFKPDANLPGYVRAGSFEGTVMTAPRWHCTGEGEGRVPFDPDAGGVDILAFDCGGRYVQANVEVEPATPPWPGEPSIPSRFTASWTKSVGIATVTYSISVEGESDSAVFSDDLSEGTIKPPPPFHGEATILKQGDGWTWTGSLSARFPGRTVALAGQGFETYVRTFKPSPNTSYAFAYSVSC